MKRTVVMVIVLVVVSATLPIRTHAERVLTEKQMAAISRSCSEVQSELDRLHDSDAVMRRNLGQQYENILTSLIAPLNSRLSLNQIDNVALAQTAVDYTDALTEWRKTYIDYEKSTTSAIKMSCENQPIEFYSAIETARQQRKLLRKRTIKLNNELKQYRQQFLLVRKHWSRADD